MASKEGSSAGDKAPLYTCVTCHVAFKDPENQRSHFQTEWHAYNLKRKGADMKPVTKAEFEAKLEGTVLAGWLLERRETDRTLLASSSSSSSFLVQPSSRRSRRRRPRPLIPSLASIASEYPFSFVFFLWTSWSSSSAGFLSIFFSLLASSIPVRTPTPITSSQRSTRRMRRTGLERVCGAQFSIGKNTLTEVPPCIVVCREACQEGAACRPGCGTGGGEQDRGHGGG